MADSLEGLPSSYRPHGMSDEEWLGHYPGIIDELVDGYDEHFRDKLMRGDDIAHKIAATTMMSAGSEAEIIGEKAWYDSNERVLGLWNGDPHSILTEVKIRHTRQLYDQAVRDPFITY